MLTSIHIKNYRSCFDTKIESLGNVTALIGRNGAGKSNILRAIEWLSQAACKPASDFKPVDLFYDSSDEPVMTVCVEIDGSKYTYKLGPCH